MGLAQIKMPQLGESVTEGTVDKWLKHEGDFVKRDEPLVEVVTDKVNAEIPSPFEGKLVKISATEGETVRVGAVIAEIEVAGAGAPTAAAAPANAPASGPAPEAGVAHTEVPTEPDGSPGPAGSAPASPPPCASWLPSTGSTLRRYAAREWAAGSPATTSSLPSDRARRRRPLLPLLLCPPHRQNRPVTTAPARSW